MVAELPEGVAVCLNIEVDRLTLSLAAGVPTDPVISFEAVVVR